MPTGASASGQCRRARVSSRKLGPFCTRPRRRERMGFAPTHSDQEPVIFTTPRQSLAPRAAEYHA